jgi:hypothetical protein
MALFIRRSILKRSVLGRSILDRSIPDRPILNRLWIVAFYVTAICVTPLALAQRPAGGVVRMSGVPVHHAYTSSASVFHAPAITPRVSTVRSTGAFAMAGFLRPRRPIRPFPPVFLVYWSPFAFDGPFPGFNCWWANCNLFWPWMFDYTTVSSPGPVSYAPQAYEAPVLDYGPDYGEEGPDMPQLYLKDGSILNVTDYWLVDDQLHFTIIQEYGAKPEEQVIPFEALDLQKTVDVNTRRGFRFMLRNEPFEQYVRDHPEGPPPALTAPPQ